jgi:hypothetical protein
MMIRTLILAATFVLGGCSTLTDYGPVSKKTIKDEQGHVVGYKQLLRNERTGEVVAQVALFSPIIGDSGAVVGYEERSRDGGAIIRDLNGRSIGGRFTDSRSKGFTLVVRARGFDQALEAENVAWARREKPGVVDILASLSDRDLNRIR